MYLKRKAVCHSLFHIIIMSNGGKKFLTRVNQDILYAYISSVVYNKFCQPIKINGHANHIHLALKLGSEISVGQLVKEIQQNTTDFLRRENSVFPEFSGWDSGYIALSYHPEQKDELEAHIGMQFNYHRKVSFEEELESMGDLVKEG